MNVMVADFGFACFIYFDAVIVTEDVGHGHSLRPSLALFTTYIDSSERGMRM